MALKHKNTHTHKYPSTLDMGTHGYGGYPEQETVILLNQLSAP